jgi:hypothetical protein
MDRWKNQQEPVWDNLIDKVDVIREKLEGHVTATNERVKESLGPTLEQQYKDADDEFQSLCAWPQGMLTRVKLFREATWTTVICTISYTSDKDYTLNCFSTSL